ncbi:AlbA family DNA-binding domain-containing protein [Patulibacter sp. S7RM1-6]
MWTLMTAEAVAEAATSGHLKETSVFDAKRELGSSKKNPEIAKDIAAMSTDGGVLLYGVAEDENHEPTIPMPFDLTGASDRVAQIVETSISEPPRIILHTLRTDADPSVGFLVIEVPMSPRAPHQVVVGGDFRYYGRGTTGNRKLSQGEVARLYDRRLRWEVDRDDLLKQTISASRFADYGGANGHFHGFVRPVGAPQSLMRTAIEEIGREDMAQAMLSVGHGSSLSQAFSPSFGRAGYWEMVAASQWRWGVSSAADQRNEDPSHLVEAFFSGDGSVRAFSGRIGGNMQTPWGGDYQYMVFEAAVAGLTTAMLGAAALVLRAGGFNGSVDFGVALTNIKGAGSGTVAELHRDQDDFQYAADEFRATDRVSLNDLEDPDTVANALLSPFNEAITRTPGFNPFEWATSRRPR